MKSQFLRISPRRFINLFVTALICFFTAKSTGILNPAVGRENLKTDNDHTEDFENIEHTHDDKMCQAHNRDCIQKVTTTELANFRI